MATYDEESDFTLPPPLPTIQSALASGSPLRCYGSRGELPIRRVYDHSLPVGSGELRIGEDGQLEHAFHPPVGG